MERHGLLRPETPDEAREAYRSLAPTATTIVRESARAMGFDREEMDERVTDGVYATAHEALYASLLSVIDGSREEFESWRGEFDGEVTVMGGENVERVVWHEFSGEGLAATYQNEPEAARGTLRRMAFGRLYRDVLHE